MEPLLPSCHERRDFATAEYEGKFLVKLLWSETHTDQFRAHTLANTTVTAIENPTPDPRSLDDDARPFAEAISLHYVKREIGRGGNGVVNLARDRRLESVSGDQDAPVPSG